MVQPRPSAGGFQPTALFKRGRPKMASLGLFFGSFFLETLRKNLKDGEYQKWQKLGFKGSLNLKKWGKTVKLFLP